jgi:hypothetical protein
MTDDEPDIPLICGDNSGDGMNDYYLEYDEDGSLSLARALGSLSNGGTPQPLAGDFAGDTANLSNKPCRVTSLKGSWYLRLTPRGPHTFIEIRGPMRIEVASPKLRISGDIYVHKPTSFSGPVEIMRPITEKPQFFGKNWYPHLPFKQYSWYFRSLGVTYRAGKLVFKFERSLWNSTTQEFINQTNGGQDQGFMQLECRSGNTFTHPLLPQPTLMLTGTAQIGGETYDVVATKTSPFYRGCVVEVDVMKNRKFPTSATTFDGAALSFASIYRTAGFDCAVTVDQQDIADDPELTSIELQTALATNRRAANNEAWRLWLLVGSSQGSLFGLMFDDIEPFREGTAGFFDPEFDNAPFIAEPARNKKLGDVPEAFLRTLVHEAGHAFNLFHPKHDVHVVPIGTTIMNQTGDVMGFATEANPYPNNVTFAFDEHCRMSLIHSPDPQVAPGWKRFGWGHGSLSRGLAEPVDAAGFLRSEPLATDLIMELTIPENIFRGEYVTARFVVTNIGTEPRTVSSAINLSQGDLRLLVKAPAEEIQDVRDVILACGDRPVKTLNPGESLEGNAQIFYTNVGPTFRQTGRYYVSAELSVGDSKGTVIRSNTVAVIVRPPATPEEEEIAALSMDLAVGRAFAFGDYGLDEEARKKLEALASKHASTDTGAAAALTLSNALGRSLRDLHKGGVYRKADQKRAKAHFDKAAKNDPHTLVRLASSVAAPIEANASVIERTADYLKQQPSTDTVESSDADNVKGKTITAAEDALDMLSRIRDTLASAR